MPYIKKDDGRREALRNRERALSAGELNYQIFHYVKHTSIDFNSGNGYGDIMKNITVFIEAFLGTYPNYQRYNDMTGALIRCSKEIKRRLGVDAFFLEDIIENYDDEIAEYEDEKIKENGDVE